MARIPTGRWAALTACIAVVVFGSSAGSAGARDLSQQSMAASLSYLGSAAPNQLAPHYGCMSNSVDRFGNLSRIWLLVTSSRTVTPARRLARRAGNSDRISIRVIPKRFGDHAMRRIGNALRQSWPLSRAPYYHELHSGYFDQTPPWRERCPGWDIWLFESDVDGPTGDWARSAVARFGADRITLSIIPDGSAVPVR